MSKKNIYKIDVKHGAEFTNKFSYKEAEIWKSKSFEGLYEYRVGPFFQSIEDSGKWSLWGVLTEDRFNELKPMFK